MTARTLGLFVLGVVLGLLLIWAATIVSTPTFDDTDAPPRHSGMRSYTDALTGCQYLATRNGALTPRMNAAGQQICGDTP